MKTIIRTILTSLLLIGVGAVAYMYSGFYDVGASTPHNGLSNWAMSTTMRASIERRAKDTPVPDLDDNALVRAGVNDFEATKHGIKMTGMPAWGATHDDESLWPVVALMVALPELDAKSYGKLLASAEGHGHHANDNTPSNTTPHDHGDPASVRVEEVLDEPAKEAPEHDHSTHEH